MIEVQARKLFWDLEKLRFELGFDHRLWAEALQLTRTEYERGYFKGEIPVQALIALCDRFNLSLNIFGKNTLDSKAVRAHYFGDETYIPQRYTVGAFSKKKTLLNLLDLVERQAGAWRRKEVLKDLQLTEGAIGDPEGNINIVLMKDAFQAVSEIGFSPESFTLMGASSVESKRMAPLRKVLSEAHEPQKIYEQVINEMIGFFEKNCSYKLVKLSNVSAVVEVRTNESVRDLLHLKEVGCSEICRFKQGMLSAFPVFLGLPKASVKEIQCVHRANSCCRFILDFAHADYISKHMH